ncbi:MAG: GPP34 family phosphoprotein [Bryobacterales bacterium]|nr:GPP34 family phosphoprotein [Bryobacterales bacterium]MDE0628667.1 GPP34 family phosphoprotein [Bryobacterales bacterium]
MFHRCRDRRQDNGVKTKTEVDATHSLLRERAYSAFTAERHMRHPISIADLTPLGDDLLDPTLAEIVADVSSRVGEAGGMHRSHDAAYWIEKTTKSGSRIRSVALARLGELGILESASEGAVRLTAGVSRSRCYTELDGQSVEDVRLGIMRRVFSDDISDPLDAVIIALAEASGAFDGILSESERRQVQERIDRFRQLDLIGRSVAAALSDVAEQDVPVIPRAKTIPKAPGLP